ncbi:ABC transporter ATP-binding protein [Staphylococcus sp. SQ8-PEA]|uniref:ABC transporter ATP-binding protein n=1 Tax=Staphylococcus marylandisciuri TaxID=2981529 RepID=A0ABT2QQC2_9STAP|nr:ABC transporter ATP-binding protein [Staphylococcus marylandisciuri]MCU5746176.1 ABC transporter ATP-binding protein [Staphylococcus marylandisciuri]
MNAIEVNNVSYKNKRLDLKDISFEVPQGFVTGFIGANGSGKTTLVRLIMNLLTPQSGSIRLFDQFMRQDEINIKEKIGFVYSELYLNEKWTIKKAEKMIAPFYKNWNHDTFHDYLKKFDLPYKAKIKTLSTGMKMKLNIALAFSHEAELFILDEPTAGLDPIVRNEVLNIIQEELLNENKTVFISTHIISDLEKIADYLVYLKDGKIILNDYLNEILNSYKIVRGESETLDEELKSLTVYCEEARTGYTALTQEAHVFEELFGNKVMIDEPTIEELMIYLGKGTVLKSNSHESYGNDVL